MPKVRFCGLNMVEWLNGKNTYSAWVASSFQKNLHSPPCTQFFTGNLQISPNPGWIPAALLCFVCDIHSFVCWLNSKLVLLHPPGFTMKSTNLITNPLFPVVELTHADMGLGGRIRSLKIQWFIVILPIPQAFNYVEMQYVLNFH